MHKINDDLKYLIQSFDLCLNYLWLFPFTKKMLSDQFKYIYIMSEVNVARSHNRHQDRDCRVKGEAAVKLFISSFLMRFSQVPLCRYRFKVIFDDIISLLSGNIIE